MGSNPAGSATAGPDLTRHFKRLYPNLGELERAADAARSLVTSPGWPVLLDLLGAEIATIDAGLDTGRVLEQAEYAAKHGRRGGLRASSAFMHALIETADAELAEQRRRHEGGAESSPERG